MHNGGVSHTKLISTMSKIFWGGTVIGKMKSIECKELWALEISKYNGNRI